MPTGPIRPSELMRGSAPLKPQQELRGKEQETKPAPSNEPRPGLGEKLSLTNLGANRLAQIGERLGLKDKPAGREQKPALEGLGRGLNAMLGRGKSETSGEPTVEQARSAAEELWFGPVKNRDSYRTVERDARDVNGSSPRDVTAKAQEQLKTNRPLEDKALAGMSESERKQYQTIKEQTQNDPQAALALQILLLEGTLTDKSKPNTAGKNLLESLNDLSTQPVHQDIDQAKLVSDLVQELAVPSAINQKNRGTCTVTTLQIMMAMEEPAELTRIVGGLASPDGKVKLANGDTIAREEGTEKEDGSSRSISARLWQASLMEYGNGGKVTYDNSVKDGLHSDGRSGLSAKEVDRIMDGLMGENVKLLERSSTSQQDIFAEIQKAAQAGELVPVGLEWGQADDNGEIHGGHKVLVTKIDIDQERLQDIDTRLAKLEASKAKLSQQLSDIKQAPQIKQDIAEVEAQIASLQQERAAVTSNPRVYYHNPWGKEESMSAEDFTLRLKSAHFVDA